MKKEFCDSCGEEVELNNAYAQFGSVQDNQFCKELCVKCAKSVLHHIEMLKVCDSIIYYKGDKAVGYATDIDKLCPLV